jgi:NADPH-dependent glutamate synthase beta subunit-like oxidoreductase
MVEPGIMPSILFDSWFVEPCGPLSGNGASTEVPKKHREFFASDKPAAKNRAVVGWGGLVLLGDPAAAADSAPCVVELLRDYFSLVWENSCGKCVPCRVGTKVISDRLTRLAAGQATAEEIDGLESLMQDIRTSCKCAYGTAFQKPLRDALRYFRAQFDHHLAGNSGCAAGAGEWFMTAPCNHGCPANTDAARYIELITEEKYITSHEVAYEPDTFAACLGRACFHPCETLCKRGDVDEPIAISYLKRYPTDYASAIAREEQYRESFHVSAKSKPKVAVIGAGPASVQCAHDLACWDYDVTIFEAEQVVGGVAYLGIPEYRLPRPVVVGEIERVQRLGVEVQCGKKLGRDFTLEDLQKWGFASVFLGIGCLQGKKMNIPGEDLPGVYDAIEYLRRINLGDKGRIGAKVIIVGGGNSAIDAARISLHMGYQDVTLVYRRTRKEMPASSWEVDEAEHEGVRFRFLSQPVRVVEKNGKAAGLQCLAMELGEPDASGRRAPVAKPGSEHVIEADVIVAAVSQGTEIDYFRGVAGLEITKWGTFKVDEDTMQTSVPWIFAGGDAATGPDSIIASVATGRKGACGIDKHLHGGRGTVDHSRFETMLKMRKIIDALGCTDKSEWNTDLSGDPRAAMPSLPVGNRANSFVEVDFGFDEATALSEASRCLRCYRIIMTV